MSVKILTVDDSKIMRMFVTKTLKPFACEVTEACNGQEGLAAAMRDKPDLIIMDISMPVMDGVEALAKLKSDPVLKSIPVMMLTGESDQGNVLKTIKLGVRDYLVKPLKAEPFLEKVGKIVHLEPLAGVRKKTFSDMLTLIVVEDKPASLAMITDGLKAKTPWRVIGKATGADAAAEVVNVVPDAIIISMSLANNEGEILYRDLKENPRSRAAAFMAMCVKIDQEAQARAVRAGFTAVVTKPIDIDVMVRQVMKALHIDAATLYFSVLEDTEILTLPAKVTSQILDDVTTFAGNAFSEMVDAGRTKIIIDATAAKEDDGALVRLILLIQQKAQELKIRMGVAGSQQKMQEIRSLKEAAAITVGASVSDVKNSMAEVKIPSK